MLEGAKSKLSSVFNSTALKAAKWGLLGGQIGLDLAAVAVVATGVSLAASLILAFGAVAGAVATGLVTHKILKGETGAPAAAPQDLRHDAPAFG